MGYFTMGVLGFTLISVLIDSLLGLLRGRNRAILRLILVVVSAVASIFLIDVFVPIIMDIKFGGTSLKELISQMFTGDSGNIPEKLQVVIASLVEVIIGIIVYFLIFGILKFITWALIYPICKIFVKKGAKKRKLFGMLIGLLEGVIVSFLICAPVTGLVKEVDKLSQISMNGKQLLPIPEEVGIQDYADSTLFKIYDKTGKWYYELVSSKKDANGNDISLSDTIDVVVTTTEVANKAQDLGDGVKNITKDDATPQDRVDGLNQIGGSLIDIDESINNLDDGGKQLLKELIESVIDMAVSGGEGEGSGDGSGDGSGESSLPPEVTEFIENIDFDDLSLKETGEAVQGIATYIEKTTSGFEKYGEEVTQEEVSSIINGIGENAFILDMIGGEGDDVPTLIQVEAENQAKFENAISANDKLTSEDKDMLRKLFGLD